MQRHDVDATFLTSDADKQNRTILPGSVFVLNILIELGYEIFFTVILSLPLIQEGPFSISGDCTILVIRLEV